MQVVALLLQTHCLAFQEHLQNHDLVSSPMSSEHLLSHKRDLAYLVDSIFVAQMLSQAEGIYLQ